MNEEAELRLAVDDLKKILVKTTIEHDFNFQHPSVLHISRELDRLILKAMKGKELCPV
ncbi:aspartyl-phosphate phosphatase Spo0E family protein [Aneurinibacillus tyrosinisolvens]|uniref:aspartyl-phosphate phosphatase Spo0E family protein n=1 Tax=Aneurinibacillus tyrosinisolvens TaxID=1443435 RepID=UPI000A3FD61D|nr:aspartyl-phosphate phosphatase Spo0E family protein [Aneurinibacillus tyrosinisolvens]